MPMSTWLWRAAVAMLVACALSPGLLRAEVSSVRISKQYGLPYLSLAIVEQQRLIEKHARIAGLGEVKVEWVTIGSGGSATDSMLAGGIDLVSTGASNMLLLWSRTGGQVKGLGATGTLPILLVARDPKVKTIADLGDRDRIAVPTVKVSIQSTILGIAATRMYGSAGRKRFDAMTVAMAHPDATIALLSGTELTAHFSAPPYQYEELKAPGVHAILDSTELMGGPTTITTLFGTVRFHDANPRLMAAIVAALREATAFAAAHRHEAAELYLRVSHDRIGADALADMLGRPGFVFTVAPAGIQQYADQMYETGVIKTRPGSWKDVFFPEVHDLPGS